MRNDARPIGEDSSLKSGEGPHQVDSPIESDRPDHRDSVAHGRESHVVHREAERDRPDGPSEEDDAGEG